MTARARLARSVWEVSLWLLAIAVLVVAGEFVAADLAEDSVLALANPAAGSFDR